MYLIYNNTDEKYAIRGYSTRENVVTIQTKDKIPENNSGFKIVDANGEVLDDFLAFATKYNNTDIGAAIMYSNDGITADVDEYYEKYSSTEQMKIILENAKTSRIAESKTKLAEWLNANPMLYSDGNYYSVTEEKQTLLNSNLTSYERATSAGIPYPLKWNSTGAECTEWTYEALVGLSLAIAAYVAPKVAAQQAVELEIKACETAEQLEKVVIDYDNG
ncbi:MAG: hypothetical protein IJF18_00865 [Oscillospiraceae bacterium]|nr:hypothetical protein [Oscillospiraceae bacterium]